MATLSTPLRLLLSRLIARYGLLFLFLLGIPLAAYLGFLLLPLVANYLGYDPQTAHFGPSIGPY